MGNIGAHTINWSHLTCELGYWILGDFEGQGFGSQLINSLKSKLKTYGVRSLQVRTLGDTVDYKPYAQTRAFYLRNEFQKIQTILHPDNPEFEAEWVLSHALS